MNKDKSNKSSHCLIERAVEKMLKDEADKQQAQKSRSNVIQFTGKHSSSGSRVESKPLERVNSQIASPSTLTR